MKVARVTHRMVVFMQRMDRSSWGQCPKGKEVKDHQNDWKTRLQRVLGMERKGGDLIKITKDND